MPFPGGDMRVVFHIKNMKNYVLKIYKNNKTYLIEKTLLREGARDYGKFYTVQYNEKPKRLIKRLDRYGIYYKWYRSEYERAGNYRQVFFERTKGPYRCRYCHRRLKKAYMQIDHIVPVAAVQRSAYARFLLHLEGAENVNSIRNLAPACKKCNKKKLDKMGLWILRGWLGKYEAYWVIRRIVIVLLIVLLCIVSLALLSFVPETKNVPYLWEISVFFRELVFPERWRTGGTMTIMLLS